MINETFRMHGTPPSHFPRDRSEALAALALLALGAFFFLLASSGFSRLHIDAALFVPVLLEHGQGQAWSIQSYTWHIARGIQRYEFHGLLYPWLFGRVLGVDSFEKLLLGSALLATLTAFATFFALRPLLPASRRARLLTLFLSVYSGYLSWWLQGRPEQLAMLCFLVSVIIFNVTAWRDSIRLPLVYGLSALTFLSSPLVGVIQIFGVLWRLCDQRTLRNSVLEIIKFGAIGLFVVAAFVHAVGLNFIDWLLLTYRGGTQSTPQDWLRLLSGWGSLQFPFVRAIATLGILAVLLAAMRKGDWRLLGIGVLPLPILLPSANTYVFLAIIPLGVALMLYSRTLTGTWSLWFRGVLLVFLAGEGVAMCRDLWVQGLTMQRGQSYFAARAKFEQNITLQPDEAVAYDWMAGGGSYVVFSTPASRRYWLTAQPTLYSDGEDQLLADALARLRLQLKYIVIPQTGHLRGNPRECLTFSGTDYRLLLNDWSQQRAEFAGIRLGGIFPDYRFALYSRADQGCP